MEKEKRPSFGHNNRPVSHRVIHLEEHDYTDTKTDRAAYEPMAKKIQKVMEAGGRLDAIRRAEYHFENDGDIDDSLVDIVTHVDFNTINNGPLLHDAIQFVQTRARAKRDAQAYKEAQKLANAEALIEKTNKTTAKKKKAPEAPPRGAEVPDNQAGEPRV